MSTEYVAPYRLGRISQDLESVRLADHVASGRIVWAWATLRAPTSAKRNDARRHADIDRFIAGGELTDREEERTLRQRSAVRVPEARSLPRGCVHPVWRSFWGQKAGSDPKRTQKRRCLSGKERITKHFAAMEGAPRGEPNPPLFSGEFRCSNALPIGAKTPKVRSLKPAQTGFALSHWARAFSMDGTTASAPLTLSPFEISSRLSVEPQTPTMIFSLGKWARSFEHKWRA